MLVLMRDRGRINLLEGLPCFPHPGGNRRVGILFDLHRVHQHLVQKGDLHQVGRVALRSFLDGNDPLHHEIICYNRLNFLGVQILVFDPADQLVVVDGFFGGKLLNGGDALVDRLDRKSVV